MRSAQTSTGSPMDTHTSVYSTSAFFVASMGSSMNSSTAPVPAAMAWQVSTRAASGM